LSYSNKQLVNNMPQRKQIIDKCNEVFARAQALYGLDFSRVQVRFDLKGACAGQAGHRHGHYFIRFNTDMLKREAFDHVLNNTVPHEIAHTVCQMNPLLGRNHNSGWERVCRALGGTGATRHKEEVVYGKGLTYEYTTTNGAKVRVSQRIHANIVRGHTYSYKGNRGKLNSTCAHSIVGAHGHTLDTPIVRRPAVAHVQPVVAVVAAPAQRVTTPVPSDCFPFSYSSGTAPVQRAIAPVIPRVQRAVDLGTSKASISRNIMLTGHRAGHNYERIIADMIAACGYARQLARATYKANAARVGVPQPE